MLNTAFGGKGVGREGGYQVPISLPETQPYTV